LGPQHDFFVASTFLGPQHDFFVASTFLGPQQPPLDSFSSPHLQHLQFGPQLHGSHLQHLQHLQFGPQLHGSHLQQSQHFFCGQLGQFGPQLHGSHLQHEQEAVFLASMSTGTHWHTNCLHSTQLFSIFVVGFCWFYKFLIF
jgi:hypothetical protein